MKCLSIQIAGPEGGTNAQNDVNAGIGPALGKCTTESLTITSPGHTTPPEICGVNTGQHMFIDVTEGDCISLGKLNSFRSPFKI